MGLLLDTHIFLWYITGNSRLSATLLPLLRDPGNTLYLSVASVWEVAIKYHLGKLPLPETPGVYVPEHRQRHQIASPDLDEASVARLDALPHGHKDPFDRMLLCQAIHHGMALATQDQALRALAYQTSVVVLP